MKPLSFGKLVLIIALWFTAFNCHAQQVVSTSHELSITGVNTKVAEILQLKQAPDGVVFDIETLDEKALPQIAPYVRHQIQLIRQKFPKVDIVVVTHGAEEFALQKQADAKNQALQQMFSKLVKDDGVTVHVCGAVAGLKALEPSDFPDFVSFSPSGMAQLKDYLAIGYTLVPIRQLTVEQRQDLFDNPDRYVK